MAPPAGFFLRTRLFKRASPLPASSSHEGRNKRRSYDRLPPPPHPAWLETRPDGTHTHTHPDTLQNGSSQLAISTTNGGRQNGSSVGSSCVPNSTLYPTINGGMRNESSVGTRTFTLQAHFCLFGADLHAHSAQLSAKFLLRNSVRSLLRLVGIFAVANWSWKR